MLAKQREVRLELEPTFAVSIELLLLPTELIVKLTVELHLQHLGQHEVRGGVREVLGQQEVPRRAEGQRTRFCPTGPSFYSRLFSLETF